jgi:hypothetical protein
MGAKVKLNLPSSLWTAKDSARLAADTLAAIKLRTSKGIDANGAPFIDYSTRPLYVSYRGARLKPKGGRVSRTGLSVYYKGGYKQYKVESRRMGRGSSALVDLVLSGTLMNNLVILHADAQRFIIGLTQHVRHYGYEVNNDREFLGLSQRDVNVLVSAVQLAITRKIQGGRS